MSDKDDFYAIIGIGYFLAKAVMYVATLRLILALTNYVARH